MELFKREKQESPKERFLQIELKNTAPDKKESEDASFMDERKGIFIAMDGITRGPFTDGESYPYPSPAAEAAQAAAHAMGSFLQSAKKIDASELMNAAKAANEAVKEVNKKNGLWDNPDYLKNDLAGTVFSAFFSNDNRVIYSFMGDCRLAKINTAGKLEWISDDEVTPIRNYFPKADEVGIEERFRQVREDFRNKPNAEHPTYGALTGEKEATEYVRTGELIMDEGDTFISFSDGITKILEDDPDFAKMITTESKEKLLEYLKKRSTEKTHYDDKTLLIKRF